MFESTLPKRLVAAGLLTLGGGAYKLLAVPCGEVTYNTICAEWCDRILPGNQGVDACTITGPALICGCADDPSIECTFERYTCWPI